MDFAEYAATPGATVRLRFTILLDAGPVYPPSGPDDSVQVELGKGRILPGLERALEGMRPGETKTVRVPAELAFGPRRPERRFRVARGASAARPLRPGDAVRVSFGAGGDLPAIVEEIDGDSVLVDANHPLAGRDLTFEINVLDVIPREAMIAC